MKQPRKQHWILAAAASAALMMSAPLFGQVRVNQDGHAADANPRVGSGGVNEGGGGGGTAYGVIPNGVVTHDITGGSFFHDRTEGDPARFSGPVSRLSDRFIQGSSGVPQAYSRQNYSTAPQLFFGESRVSAPPVGTERIGTTNTFIGTQYTNTNLNSLSNEVSAGSDLLKQRTGESGIIGRNLNRNQDQVRSTDFGNNPLDAQTQAILNADSPLYGVRSNFGGEGTADEVPLFAPPSLMPGGTAGLRLPSAELKKMRDELNNSLNNSTQQDNALPGSPQQGTKGPPDALRNDFRPALDPTGNSFTTNARSDLGVNNSSLSNGVGIGGNTAAPAQRINLMTPARQQSETLKALQDQLHKYQNPQMIAIQNEVNRSNRMAAQAKARQTPGTTNTPGPTSRPAGAGVGLIPAPEINALRVQSLADGIAAKGLHDLLASAEDLMRQDKFQSAIDKYNQAQLVAPNNPLVLLGRANAELGAGYYRQANVDLHLVFQSEPALLMGQYNLKNWMNDKRLTFVNKELTELSTNDTQQEMPEFLLAYLAYNTGNEADAAIHLKNAHKRAGNSDALLDVLESRWQPNKPASPEEKPTPGEGKPDLNK